MIGSGARTEIAQTSPKPLTHRAKEALSRTALTMALKTRTKLKKPLHEAICVYDAATDLGLEVRFDAIPSLEGMYVKKTEHGSVPHIIVSSLRPAGRQAMTAAHEIGHHVFGHGTRIDQYIKSSDQSATQARQSAPSALDSDEFLADAFARFFLMPKSAVELAFNARNVSPSAASPLSFLEVAGWLGVGYSALIHHMHLSLRLIGSARANQLLAEAPKLLRQSILGEVCPNDVYVLGPAWTGRALDVKVGDRIVMGPGIAVEPFTASSERATTNSTTANGKNVLVASFSGIDRATLGSWAAFIRVEKREYAGRLMYRHLEDPDERDGEMCGK